MVPEERELPALIRSKLPADIARQSMMVDQGAADQFLENQLKPQLLENACAKAGVPLTLRMHEGYDHSYFFIFPPLSRTISAGTRSS